MPGKRNPFAVPDMVSPHQPLTPWAEATHGTYYVEVDRTEEAFQSFLDEAGEVTDLVRRGGLVVVSGNRGCGKSSVLNRCVHWVDQGLKDLKHVPFIADISLELESAGTERELDSLALRLLEQLEDRGQLKHAALEQLRARDAAGRLNGLSSLVGFGREPSALLVLLPPQEVHQALVSLAELVRPGIIFFVERVLSGDGSDWTSQVRGRFPQPIEVSVGSLKNHDAWLFAGDRINRHDKRATIPKIAELTMRQWQLNRGEVTIDELQKFMFNLYEDALAVTPPLAEITYDYIANFYVRRAAGLRS